MQAQMRIRARHIRTGESRVCARKRSRVHTQCTDVVLPFRSPLRRHLVQGVLLDLFETLQIRECRRARLPACVSNDVEVHARSELSVHVERRGMRFN